MTSNDYTFAHEQVRIADRAVSRIRNEISSGAQSRELTKATLEVNRALCRLRIAINAGRKQIHIEETN